MAKKHLKREPHNVSDDSWWYEENQGICVVIKSRMVSIPWRSIRAALKRKDK